MDALPFLHAGHQVRETLGGLELVSWLAIGLGVGALVLTWGKIFAWLRAPEVRRPRVRRWGEDEAGYYFEVEPPGEWSLELEDGTLSPLQPGAAGELRASAGSRPVALHSSGGARLPL